MISDCTDNAYWDTDTAQLDTKHYGNPNSRILSDRPIHIKIIGCLWAVYCKDRNCSHNVGCCWGAVCFWDAIC